MGEFEILNSKVEGSQLKIIIKLGESSIWMPISEEKIKEMIPHYDPKVMPLESLIPQLIGKTVVFENIHDTDKKTIKREKRLQKRRDKRKRWKKDDS